MLSSAERYARRKVNGWTTMIARVLGVLLREGKVGGLKEREKLGGGLECFLLPALTPLDPVPVPPRN